jgi:hypothetical protein
LSSVVTNEDDVSRGTTSLATHLVSTSSTNGG